MESGLFQGALWKICFMCRRMRRPLKWRLETCSVIKTSARPTSWIRLRVLTDFIRIMKMTGTSESLVQKTIQESEEAHVQREASFPPKFNAIHRRGVITWHVNAPEDKVVSRAGRGDSFYSRSSPTQMLTESPPSAWRRRRLRAPLLVSRVDPVGCHSQMKQRVKCEHRHTCTSGRTHTVASRHKETSALCRRSHKTRRLQVGD